MIIADTDVTKFGARLVENTKVRKGLLYEYTNYLTGATETFSSAYFGRGNASNPLTALEVFHYAFEIFLDWTPEQVDKCLNKEIIDLLKLNILITYLDIPQEVIVTNNYRYIAHLMYPSLYSYDEDKLTRETYHSVNLGKENGGLAKYPKGYFDGITGRHRALICLNEFLKDLPPFFSVRDMYSFFASEEGTQKLTHSNLKLVFRTVFLSPVQYLHEMLPPGERNEFFYHYYELIYQLRTHQREKYHYVSKKEQAKEDAVTTEQNFYEVKKICERLFKAGKPVPVEYLTGINAELYQRAVAQYLGNKAAGVAKRRKIKRLYEFFVSHPTSSKQLIREAGLYEYIKENYQTALNFIHSVYQNEFWLHYCLFEKADSEFQN